MKSVNIAKFKTELGKYLRFVRKGEEIIVLDRTTPIAVVSPYAEAKISRLEYEEPSEDPRSLFKIKIFPSKKRTDSLKYLIEERGNR